MPGLFPPWSDTFFRLVLVALVLAVIGTLLGLMIYVRTPYSNFENYAVEQPVQFDHRHHARDDGIPCLYCHRLAERSSTAGIPATELCMGCHAQIWNQSEKLKLVRDAFFTNQPIPWRRVDDLPDFVYFNHSVHVHAGVQCQQCHGDVQDMPLVHKVNSFSMGFCLGCHRAPAAYVPGYHDSTGTSPLDATVFKPANEPPIVTNKLITCTACHR